MRKREIVMDRASKRIDDIHKRLSGVQNKAVLLHQKLELLATTVKDAKDLCADMTELMNELDNLSTLTHKTNWRVLAEADGVKLLNE